MICFSICIYLIITDGNDVTDNVIITDGNGGTDTMIRTQKTELTRETTVKYDIDGVWNPL